MAKRFELCKVEVIRHEVRDGKVIAVIIRVAESGNAAVYLTFVRDTPKRGIGSRVVKIQERLMPDGTPNDSLQVSKGAFRKACGQATALLYPTKHRVRTEALELRRPAWLERADCGSGN